MTSYLSLLPHHLRKSVLEGMVSSALLAHYELAQRKLDMDHAEYTKKVALIRLRGPTSRSDMKLMTKLETEKTHFAEWHIGGIAWNVNAERHTKAKEFLCAELARNSVAVKNYVLNPSK